MTVILENPAAPHQIRIVNDANYSSARIIVTCTCLGRRSGPGAGRGRPAKGVIEARSLFPAAEAYAAWLGWHQDQGIEVAP